MSGLFETDDILFSSAFHYAAIGMAIVSLEGGWLKVNKALCNIIGYSQDELMSKTFQDITHPDDLDEDLRLVHQLLAGEIETYQLEKRYFHKQGHIVHILLSVSLVKNKDGSPRFFISQIQDITRQKTLEMELETKAREDELTKVFNRRHFMNLATREVVRGNRFHEPQAVMMIDIDHFKNINDTYGHGIGDEVLRVMAKECSRSLRQVDVFGRIGGEEFGALLLNAGPLAASTLAERMRKHVEELAVETEKGTVRFTISIGLATFTTPKLPLDELLKRADEALYEAKRCGRNKVINYVVQSNTPQSAAVAPPSFIHLDWNSEYESGHISIDTQHKNLFAICKSLLEAIVSGQPDTKVSEIAHELTEHMTTHFRDESTIFNKSEYPDAEAHTKSHYALIQEVRSVLAKFQKHEATAGDLFNLLVIKMVRDHILTQDREFFPYIQTSSECEEDA
ncbi:diguanylate cyclase [Desulfovibrio subterraneus]|nr:diguanylate cyclase [Desulfovibrio subterraneus]